MCASFPARPPVRVKGILLFNYEGIYKLKGVIILYLHVDLSFLSIHAIIKRTPS